jgi:menaquinone-dependent protoporphyrinogen oxidase
VERAIAIRVARRTTGGTPMARILIVYGTTEGHTAQIAARMADAIRADGHDALILDSKAALKDAPVDGFDGIIVGGSVHVGEHQSSLREFAKRNRGLLERVPSAFFSVSLAAADADGEATAEMRQLVDRFVAETGWKPARVEFIAGALVYTQYNFFIRHMMKIIVRRGGHTELDTSRDYDFTDWDAVDRFARDFARGVPAAAAP